MGVTVTRMSMNLHTQVLSQACSYTEGKHKTLISKLRFSFTVPYFFNRSSGENLLKYQLDSSSLIMYSILMTTLFSKALIL